MDEQSAIRHFMGERPGAGELRGWLETLEQRLQELESARARDETLQPRILRLRQQVAALRQEHAITAFVEDSLRVTLAMGSLAPDGEQAAGEE